jgi:hypothetical protein
VLEVRVHVVLWWGLGPTFSALVFGGPG